MFRTIFRIRIAYFGRVLLIVGGRNSAVEAALRCHRAGARVSLCYRGAAVDLKATSKYWLRNPEFSSLVKAGKIAAHFGSVAREITPTHVMVAPCPPQASPQPTAVPADFIPSPSTGYIADMSLAKMAGCVELSGRQPCEVPAHNEQTMETNVPGVYVAGTAIAGTQGRYKTFLENCHVHVERIMATI